MIVLVLFCRDILQTCCKESKNESKSPDSREVAVGTATGAILELSMEEKEKRERGGNVVLDLEQPVRGLCQLALPSDRRLLLVTTPARLYAFAGSGSLQTIFSSYPDPSGDSAHRAALLHCIIYCHNSCLHLLCICCFVGAVLLCHRPAERITGCKLLPACRHDQYGGAAPLGRRRRWRAARLQPPRGAAAAGVRLGGRARGLPWESGTCTACYSTLRAGLLGQPKPARPAAACRTRRGAPFHGISFITDNTECMATQPIDAR